MKKFFMRSILFLFIVFFIMHPQNLTATAKENNQYDFTYSIINEKAIITGFSGKPIYLEIPEKIDNIPVTSVRDNAFFRCSSLKQISLPSGITEIGHHAFFECSSLESIVIPSSVIKIGMGAFSGCSSISAVSLSENLEILPDSCFRSCTSLTEIIIPDNITEIEKYCFYGCKALSYVALGNNLNILGSRCFYMCTNLKKLYIPPSTDNIGFEAAGYTISDDSSSLKQDFTIYGNENSAAKEYAASNNIHFSEAADALHANAISKKNVKRIPLWFLLLLTCGGIGFFALSCVIAVKQHLHEKKHTDHE